MNPPALIRFDPRAALERWPDYPESEIASGTRINHGTILFEDKAMGLSTGLWQQDANESHWMVYPVHEFMIILEGTVTIVEEDCSTTVRAGESFVIPKGTRLRWTQKDRVRKIFVIIEDAADGPPAPHAIKLAPDGALPSSPPPSPEVLLSSPPPRQGSLDAYEAMTGRLSVGVWETTPYRRKLIAFPRHELMHLLAGEVTMTDASGHSAHFSAGDTFFVPHGTPNAWESHGTLRKLFCILMPPA